jgi:energy-coupling factor transporter ATP-binding protein EcfA2
MLTRLRVRNFKKLEMDIELGRSVVFIGPNNSGKTSALQALALWDIGLKRWNEKRKGKTTPEKRPGVTINRRDLVAAPVPNANLLWRDLHVRDVQNANGKQDTKNIRIEIVVEGLIEDTSWKCGLEFDYANEESFYCRPLRFSEKENTGRMVIPDQAEKVKIAFLPPMSGLAANETRLDSGAVNVRIGEGRTAEVLRNLCYTLFRDSENRWKTLCSYIQSLFGVLLDKPEYIGERGEIVMTYQEGGSRFDLSSSGRGLQQTLLLLAYMLNNPGSVLLLDEPDAHLETLRQKEIYQMLTVVARESESQIIAASHSEVLLNEAAGKDTVIAFVGKPHRLNDRGSQVLKSLREIGFDDYYKAQRRGWVIYLEGSTDLAILLTFADRLNHPAKGVLESPFYHYVADQPNEVVRHYYGLKEAVKDLKCIAIFDRLDRGLPDEVKAFSLTWGKKEIESYFCYPETLLAYATDEGREQTEIPLFSPARSQERRQAMEEAIQELTGALKVTKKGSPWDGNMKVSDDFLPALFDIYFEKLNLPNIMAKGQFYQLVPFVPVDKIDKEIIEKLDKIVAVAQSAKPYGEE